MKMKIYLIKMLEARRKITINVRIWYTYNVYIQKYIKYFNSS